MSENKRLDHSGGPLLGSSNKNSGLSKSSPAPGYQSIAPTEYYYVDDNGDDDFMPLHSKHKYTYWIALTVIAIPLIYFYFKITLGIEPNYILVPDLVRVESLKLHHAPSHDLGKRLVLVGDVHGKLKSFRNLLVEVKFNPETDHLVLLGDMISKGPNSIELLDYVMALNASCVRGNHEDNILNQYANVHKLPTPKITPPQESSFDNVAALDRHVQPWFAPIVGDDKTVARKLKPEHVRFLGTCPAILELGKVGVSRTSAVAVHAGLQWNIENLQDQDPEIVFSIRSLLPPLYTTPSEDSDGSPWSAIWNRKQKEKLKSERMSVFYGHDARNGLTLRKYTTGLDTGCVIGGKLTAMVISENAKGKLLHEVISVRC